MTAQNNFLEALDDWVNTYLFRSLTEYFIYLKTTDISMQQAYVLTFIYYQGPSTISEICEHMLVSPAAASQMVDRLEKLDLVGRSADPSDRRVRKVILLEAGESFVRQSLAARQSWVKEIPTELSDDQFEQISAALQTLVSLYQA